jgi:superfamily II DNA or RNA helicase
VIDVATAARLLDFDAVIGNPQHAREQLEGAVALHNILKRRRVAYLADEVGMGKTYVALGVVALLRHFQPDARVLFLAPRENIQRKWQKELRLFVKNNVRVADLRVRTPAGTPVRPLVHCPRLIDLIRETSLDPERDFFARLPSFSLPLTDDTVSRRTFRDRLHAELPWLPGDLLDLRAAPAVLKERFAQALNAALPPFDLVVVDEAHNLKHGFAPGVASRNRVLATALGHSRVDFDPRLPATGPLARMVLLLSATPLDDDYAQLWRQLDLFDRGGDFRVLVDDAADDEAKRAVVADLLVRRVTTLRVDGQRLTKNLYRREWRSGGVDSHDEPIPPGNDRQRLTVALVQRKVTELLEHERFGASFQIGMLASFESFLETAGGGRLDAYEDGEAPGDATFDGAEQTDDVVEREGVDVEELNGLARSHRRAFGRELAHPKMDALVDQLSRAWRDGSKALVFVRRVASVAELKARLDDAYDAWLLEWLRGELPERHYAALAQAEEAYRRERGRRRRRRGEVAVSDETEDPGDVDTFFSYFFRGHPGPPGIVSGARIQRRLQAQSGSLATFFADNHVMGLLGAAPGSVVRALAARLGQDETTLRDTLRERSRHYLSARAKVVPRGPRFAAAQAAALELLEQHDPAARAIYDELFRSRRGDAVDATADPDQLETRTFFSELRRRPALRAQLWPEPAAADPREVIREARIRGHLLAAAARLGHAFLDLWVVVAASAATLVAEADRDGDEDAGEGLDAIDAYLDRLELQSRTPVADRGWRAFDELRALAEHHELILDVNVGADDRDRDLDDVTNTISRLLTAQRPVARMSGKVTPRLVSQFRMPGYPVVMVTTDVLQEGEDLHTFCSTVHHYGLAWTPSALEQRVGRIDRVRSATERRLTALRREPTGDEKLQVHYPHLADTVERLQVRRVLRRMDDFIRLMHTELAVADGKDGRVDIRRELLEADGAMPQPPAGELHSAFDVRERDLRGRSRLLAVDERVSREQLMRFVGLANHATLAGVPVGWERPQPAEDLLLGTAQLATGRIQPFSLQLGWWARHLVVRCVSPVGLVDLDAALQDLAASCRRAPVTLGVVRVAGATYNVTVEEDVMLAAPAHDHSRVGALVRRVTAQADELELRHLPDRDHDLDHFRDDIARDLHHAR